MSIIIRGATTEVSSDGSNESSAGKDKLTCAGIIKGETTEHASSSRKLVFPQRGCACGEANGREMLTEDEEPF